MVKCTATRIDGESCRALALRGGQFCWWHDATRREQMLDASRRGGLNRRKPVLLPEREPLTPDRTRGILAAALEALLAGALDDRTVRTLAYVVAVDGKMFENFELEKRVEALENVPELSRKS